MNEPYCVRCEQPIVLGGLLYLAGMEKPQQMCLGCALHEASEYNKSRGIKLPPPQILRPDDEDLEL